MESERDCIHKGSNSSDSMDAERVTHMPNDNCVGICKCKEDWKYNFYKRSSICMIPKQESSHGVRKKKSTKVECRKMLIEMLLHSDMILQKALKLREESKLLLEDACDDTHAAAS